ncbi:Hypothetical protein A7982_00849 [Minicystis rosea]|nr:Hypothetical protein A7982_00849 [Minicystis rosea]
MSARAGLRAIAARHRDLVAVTLAALAVRLVWNLVVHKPLDYAFSDMGAYLARAESGLGERSGYFTLFPWGTHVMLMALIRTLGRGNGVIGSAYALLGAGAVAYGFLLARRLSRSVWVGRVVGALLVVYYPWIAIGGYVLSEPPFALFLTAAAYHGLVLADRGRPSDAWAFGAATAIAAAFRPQILLALPLYAIHFAVRRRAWRALSPALVVRMTAPIALVLMISAARARYHTGHLGTIASNGPLNFAFGRCHAQRIAAFSDDRRSAVYSPPPLSALARYEVEHPDALFKLHPAIDAKLEYQGQIWEAAPLTTLAMACMRRSGAWRQVEYAATHVAMLWHYNVMWPDQNARPPFPKLTAIAGTLHEIFVLPAALVTLVLAVRRRHARVMLLGLHVAALLAVAVVFFGDTRLRVPYDGILVVLATMTYASAWRVMRRRAAT